MSEIAEMYDQAVERSAALIDLLSLIQRRFPSSTNDDWIRTLERVHTELVQAWQDRCREQGEFFESGEALAQAFRERRAAGEGERDRSVRR